MQVNLDFVCDSVKGRLIGGNAGQSAAGVATDSRQIKEGDLFIALKGERFDGHSFVEKAFAQGAAAAIVSCQHDNILDKDKAVILVKDTLQALQDLAGAYRQRFKIPVAAVTGSVGKTSTKDILALCLNSQFNTLKTVGNYNNDIGLPLTLLKLEEDHQAAVVEMGMRARGEIARLAAIAQPTCAVISNIEPVHLETLGSLENIALAKCEVLAPLRAGDFALINGDYPLLVDAASSYLCRKYTFGYNQNCDFRIEEVCLHKNQGIDISVCYLDKHENLFFPLPSLRWASNVVSAAAAAFLLGIGMDKIASVLAKFEADTNRLNLIRLKEGGIIINDTYNANPASMAAALETGQELPCKGKWVAVLGDMFELGEYEDEGHLEVGRKAAVCGVDILVAVGERAALIAQGAIERGMSAERVHHFNSKSEGFEYLDKTLDAADTILFKASRGMEMETLSGRFVKKFMTEI